MATKCALCKDKPIWFKFTKLCEDCFLLVERSLDEEFLVKMNSVKSPLRKAK